MKILLLFYLLFLQLPASAQQTSYWQQEVNYKINVSLDVNNKTLHGFEQIQYINHSPDTLRFIWFHLWPNAYKNKSTAYAQQYGSTYSRNNIGYIDSLLFTVDNDTVKTEPHPAHIDILKLLLNKPLLPGDSITISTPFFVQLPRYVSRLGYVDKDFYISQWYPKPAVFDRKGWHPMPYLNRGEFYSEFGNFDVSITLPSTYVVAATGMLKTEEELRNYKLTGTKNIKGDKIKYLPTFDSSHKTLRFQQHNIHDFAWFTSEDFIIRYNKVLLNSQHIVDVFTYSYDAQTTFWKTINDNTSSLLFAMKEQVGEYPYNTISVIQGSSNRFSGGMEYPTACLLNVSDYYVLSHEIIHNWFYGIIGTNERNHAWMDEGLTDWYSQKISGVNSSHNYETNAPIDQPSQDYKDMDSYYSAVYGKAARWLTMLREEIGNETFNVGIKQYFIKWKFRHPYPEDFQKIMEEVSGKKLNKIFALLKQPHKL